MKPKVFVYSLRGGGEELKTFDVRKDVGVVVAVRFESWHHESYGVQGVELKLVVVAEEGLAEKLIALTKRLVDEPVPATEIVERIEETVGPDEYSIVKMQYEYSYSGERLVYMLRT